MKLLRKIFLPFNLVYFLIVFTRNKLFDCSALKSISFDFPVIGVGNLSIGGTGKTPMIEYLVRILVNEYKIAVLSRGYGRKSNGFVMSGDSVSSEIIGDEPYQIKNKFPEIIVAVNNDRKAGIDLLKKYNPNLDVVLLDDSFQHRKVKPGLSILLTCYKDLYCDDILLPAGNLREPISGANRAQIIVVTKCPKILSDFEKKEVFKRLNIKNHQKLFFSSIVYDDHIKSFDNTKSIDYLKNKKFTLVTGIANAEPLLNYLDVLGLHYEHLEFPDHHKFTKNQLRLISSKTIVLTTEKDFTRLNSVKNNSIYYIPIKIEIDNSVEFINSIKDFTKNCIN